MSDPTYLRKLIAARTRAVSQGLSAESLHPDTVSATDPPHTDDVLQRLKTVLDNMPADEIGDPVQFDKARKTFLESADKSLRKLDSNASLPQGPGDTMTYEAVVRTDGTRPSLLIRNDTINPEHPLAGSWRDTLHAVKSTMRSRAAAVGRIEPANGSANRFFGTGWLVDSAKGLLLTNLHVLHTMLAAIPNAMIQTATGFRILNGGAFVDFAAEDGSLAKKLFRVVEATPSGIDGPSFERLDAAVLRIEAIGGNGGSPAMPQAVPVVADLGGPTGSMPSFCVIGFPGKPEITTGLVDGVDWTWITQTLFGSRFGVKRLAPGIAHKPAGTLPGDAKQWVFGHDATTLGGSSGSPILGWLDTNFAGFGFHFAGSTEDKNCAHAVARCQEELKRLGVPVQDPV